MGGDGKGMFTSVDDREGSEYSLGRDGYKPLFNSAMWGEAKAEWRPTSCDFRSKCLLLLVI